MSMEYKRYVAEQIRSVLDEDLETIQTILAVPPDEKMGDLAFPCFSLAKRLRKAPPLIAKELHDGIADHLEPGSLIERMEVVGAYLNFYLNRAKVASAVVSEILSEGEDYGKSQEGTGKKVLVEFSSPNIAKPFHIGHLVSTALGNSIEKIYRFLGYDTVKINHLGDWGTQFGKLITAYQKWGDAEVILQDPINQLLKIYVRFHQEAETDPSLEDEARRNFKKLEDGDPEITRLWKFFVEASLKEFRKTYDLLNITFDSYAGESFYTDKMPEVVSLLQEKGLLIESEGAQVVPFSEEENMPPCIILKSDGTTIYATRDLAAAIYRDRQYHFDRNIYVVGSPQALHFRQVFAVLEKMGFDCASRCVHVGFGYVRFPDRVISTRSGDVVLLEEVLNEAIVKTREIIEGGVTGKEIGDLEDVSQKIGVGAVLYAFLRNSRERDIIFTWKDMLDFEGESGPYVQYSYARGKSVLRKAQESGLSWQDGELSLLTGEEEFVLIKWMNEFQAAVRDAAAKYEPCCVTRYVTDLAQKFNKFYNSCGIMKAEEPVRKARLLLTEAACTCLRSAMGLLGIQVVERM